MCEMFLDLIVARLTYEPVPFQLLQTLGKYRFDLPFTKLIDSGKEGTISFLLHYSPKFYHNVSYSLDNNFWDFY